MKLCEGIYSHSLLQQHVQNGKEPKGLHLPIVPDLYLLPEYALALIAPQLRELGGPVVAKEKMLVVADHFAPPATIERADILNSVIQDVDGFGWHEQFRLQEGICHQLMLEDPRLQEGGLVIGSDSHTVMAGAKGAWASGYGSHDLLYALVTDTIWIKPDPAVLVRICGQGFPAGVSAKDIILRLFELLGAHGFHRHSIEFVDDTESGLSEASRATICNMVVDGGATNGVFVAEAWRSHLREDQHREAIEIQIDDLDPLLALPGSPFEIRRVEDHRDQKISQAFLGSCNAGRLEDFQEFARVIEGHKIKPGVRVIAIPASKQVFLEAMHAGYVQTMVEAGVVIGNPSCGPCGAIDKGILGKGDVCIATMNRNFQGRMGSKEADIYLANPAVVAASAVMGRIAVPEELQG